MNKTILSNIALSTIRDFSDLPVNEKLFYEEYCSQVESLDRNEYARFGNWFFWCPRGTEKPNVGSDILFMAERLSSVFEPCRAHPKQKVLVLKAGCGLLPAVMERLGYEVVAADDCPNAVLALKNFALRYSLKFKPVSTLEVSQYGDGEFHSIIVNQPYSREEVRPVMANARIFDTDAATNLAVLSKGNRVLSQDGFILMNYANVSDPRLLNDVTFEYKPVAFEQNSGATSGASAPSKAANNYLQNK